MFPNRFAENCTACHVRVQPNEGYAFRDATRAWRVSCKSARCAEQLGLKPANGTAAANDVTTRSLERDPQDAALLIVRMPFDRDSLPLQRALPGSKWDGERNVRTCNAAPADLPRVIELARKLGLSIPADLEQAAATGTEQEQVAAGRADTAGLYPFQREGVRFLARRARALLADDMGCIDGDATIRVNRAKRGFPIRLADLYRKFHEPGWDHSIPTHIRALCNGELRLHRIVDVLDKGIKPVVKLTLASGKTLRLTPDHEVCVATDGSRFVRADALQPGDAVITNGTAKCKRCGSTKNVVTYEYAKFPGYCRTCVYRYQRKQGRFKTGRIIDQDGYVRVSGHLDHPRHTTGGVYEHILVAEKRLGRALRPNEEVHHRNEIRHDNRPSNLRVLTRSAHATLHGRTGGYLHMEGGRGGKGGLVQFVPKIDRVVSVMPDGHAHVYDVVCADPHRNFVANGVVVHNCGKTPQTLCALSENGRTLVVCPAVVKYNWKAEAARWRPDLRVTVLSGKGSFRLPEPGEIVVLNYDLLPKAPPKPKKGQRREPLLCTWHQDCRDHVTAGLAEVCAKRELADVTLVVDEAHLVKNRDAQRTRAVQAIGALCARVWFLTGTPLANRALDLFGVLSAGGMEREVLGGWMGFVRLFNGHQNRWGGWEFGGPEPEVPERLRRVMLRRTKAEVLPDLPSVTYQTIEVNDLPRDLQRDLDEAWEEYCEDGAAPSYLPAFEEFSGLRQRLAASRINALTELVEQYEETETPLLVFSAHRAPVDTIGQREGWAAITGDTEAEDRTEIVSRFQRGELKGVALTIAAGGVGITLTRASTAIFVDLAWRPSDNWQAEDRMRRIGQLADKITVVRMVSRHPLDLHVQNLLALKIELIRRAVEATYLYQAKPGPEWREESAEEQTARANQIREQAERVEREHEVTDRRNQIERRLAREEHVELTAEQREAVRAAFGYLCSVCDGAETEDNSGFNKADQGIRRWLEVVGLNDGQAMQLAYHVVRKYPRQVKDMYPQLWTE
jgi:hypothetical protein